MDIHHNFYLHGSYRRQYLPLLNLLTIKSTYIDVIWQYRHNWHQLLGIPRTLDFSIRFFACLFCFTALILIACSIPSLATLSINLSLILQKNQTWILLYSYNLLFDYQMQDFPQHNLQTT